jgi:acetylornithine deacetylase/succinyl-diaminopimelate desuccinylase-like protein
MGTVDTERLRSTIAGLMDRARSDLTELVAFRSVANPAVEPREECLGAAERVAALLREVGLGDAALYDTTDGYPAVIAHAPAPPPTPTVLLYAHYDVQPALSESLWASPPFRLTEREGRWYGRGAADDKGNLVAHLTALRALAGEFRLGVTVIVEGTEEQGSPGLEAFVRAHPELLRADAIVIADVGNIEVGVPTLTTTLRGGAGVVVEVRALRSSLHSGMFGGAAPDALAALIAILATLRDAEGNTTIRGLAGDRAVWEGAQYPVDRFRVDATMLTGTRVLGGGTVADMLWARPALTVIGIDCPAVDGASPTIQATARAKLNLRVPPGMDAKVAQDALMAHLRAVAPWGVEVAIDHREPHPPFRLPAAGPATAALESALREAFGKEVVRIGEGGSIPLATTLHETFPEAEIALLGVEDPLAAMHAPNESVDPGEIERIALAEALFLTRYATSR